MNLNQLSTTTSNLNLVGSQQHSPLRQQYQPAPQYNHSRHQSQPPQTAVDEKKAKEEENEGKTSVIDKLTKLVMNQHITSSTTGRGPRIKNNMTCITDTVS